VKILVAGSTGLVGSALMSNFVARGFETIGVNRSTVDLTNQARTSEFLMDLKPDVVVAAAAKVGGIGANSQFPVEFLLDNLSIQNNLISASHRANVEKFIFLGSSCIYPRNAQQPIAEESLLTGELEKTNSAYAISKIAGIELIKSYRKEYGRSWISLMPTNLYGRGDNFDLNTAHVLPALIRKYIEAKELAAPNVTLWGDGSSQREFLHADDLASAVTFLIDKNFDDDLHINIGSGEEISILDLSILVAEIVGYNGKTLWDNSKPNGTPRKVLDNSRLERLGWKASVRLVNGIASTIQWYVSADAKGEVRK
jgi:GDP-L-fucose synthase